MIHSIFNLTFHRALIAGVGGIALYGALKPSGEKVIVVNGEQKPAESTTAAAAAAVTPVVATADSSSSAPLAAAPATPVTPLPGAPADSVTPADGNSTSVAPADPATAINSSTRAIPSDGSTPLAAYPVTVTMAPADIPPYSGSSVHYDQIPLAPLPSETPLAPFPSETPLAPFPSSNPPMCAPGQNPDDPLMKCTPLTVAPIYVTQSTTVDAVATVQRDVPVASSTNQNLQAQSALKSDAVSSCTVFAFNLIVIPILTLLMV